MTAKTQGSMVLDGMVQGRFDGSEQARTSFERWVKLAAARGMKFELQVEGTSFNLLADPAPFAVAPLGSQPQEVVAEALAAISQIVGPMLRAELLSTVRSVEYQVDSEVQTLYAFGPDGLPQVRSRTVDAETVAPPQPLSAKEKLKMAGLAVGALAVLLAVLSFFVDYRELWRQAMPLKAQNVEVVTGDFSDYLSVKDRTISGKSLVITLARTDRYPKDDVGIDAMASGRGTVRSRLMAEAMATGYIRLECFDEKGAYIMTVDGRISPLRKNETVELHIPIPADRRLAKVVVGI